MAAQGFSATRASSASSGENFGRNFGAKWGAKWGAPWGERTAATRFRTAHTMQRNPHITPAAVASELGMASTSGVEKHLKAMRDADCIRRVGRTKGGRWELLP